MPRNLKGGGAQFKAMPAGPYMYLLRKRRTSCHHIRRCPIFRPKSSAVQKKFSRPQIVLYNLRILLTHQESFVHLFSGGGGGICLSTQYRNINPTTLLLYLSLNLKFFLEQDVKDYLSNPRKLKLGHKPTDREKI